MNRPRMRDEVDTGPRMSSEEFRRQQVSLESIARPARQDHVAGGMSAAMSKRIHVVERREIKLERRAAIHTAASAVPHRGSFDGAFLMARRNFLGAAVEARGSWEGDSVEVPTS